MRFVTTLLVLALFVSMPAVAQDSVAEQMRKDGTLVLSIVGIVLMLISTGRLTYFFMDDPIDESLIVTRVVMIGSVVCSAWAALINSTTNPVIVVLIFAVMAALVNMLILSRVVFYLSAFAYIGLMAATIMMA